MALKSVNVKCDRCGRKIKGQEDFNFTSGFYYVENCFWSAFAYEREKIICDQCMWRHPLYVKLYGNVNKKVPPSPNS